MATTVWCNGFNPEDFWSYLDLLARYKVPKWLHRWIDANDVVQQTFERAGPHQSEWHGWNRARVAGYLRTTLQSVVRDEARKHVKERTYSHFPPGIDETLTIDIQPPGDQSTPSEIAEREEMLLDLARALKQLPERQRLAIELRYLEVPKASAVQIAEKLDCTEKAARELMNRGLRKLRQVLCPGERESHDEQHS